MKDINSSKKEFEKVRHRQHLLYDRLTAVGMDYQFYISVSNEERKFVHLRDSILFKINGIDYHIHILLRLFDDLQLKLEYIIEQKTKEKNQNNEIPLLDSKEIKSLEYTSTQQVSILFEDIIYHLVSIYDYFSSIVNYIFSITNSKEQSVKWTSLAKATRDKNHNINKLNIGDKINEVDKSFVGKLYDLRSELIHRESDVCGMIYNVGNHHPEITIHPMATDKLTKKFHELRQIRKSESLAMRYTLFWLMNKSFDSLRTMIFALKKDIESNGKSPMTRVRPNNKLIFGLVDSNQNFISPSKTFWHLDDEL